MKTKRCGLGFLLGVAAASLIAALANAEERHWVGGHIEHHYEMWHLPDNWEDSSGSPGVPGLGDTVFITNADSAVGFNTWTDPLGAMTIDYNSSLWFVGFGNLIADRTEIGVYGRGAVNMGWGSHTVNGDLVLGVDYDGEGIYNLDSGTVTVNGSLLVGLDGTGTFTQSQDNPDLPSMLRVVGHNSLVVNSNTGEAEGLLNLRGGVLVKESYEVKIGTDGNGWFEQSGGDFQFSGAMYLGDQYGGYGTYRMTGGTISAGPNGAGGVVLGEWGGQGYFYHEGGQIHIADLFLGRQVDGSGDYYLSGESTLDVAGLTRVGGPGYGLFAQTGGSHTTGSLRIAMDSDESGPGSGVYYLEDGHLLVNGDIEIGPWGELVQYGGALRAQTLVIAQGGPEGEDNGVFEFSGGTLSLQGFTGMLVQQGGVLAPGNSIGTMLIEGGYDLWSGGRIEIEIGHDGHDVLNVSDSAILNGTIDLILRDGYAPQPGDWFDALVAPALSVGDDFGLDTALAGLGDGQWWTWSIVDGHSQTLRLEVVPEPGTLALLAAGALALLRRRNRRD